MYSELLGKLPVYIQVYFMHTEPNLRWSVTLFSDMKNRCSTNIPQLSPTHTGKWQHIHPKKYPFCRKMLFIITLRSPGSYVTVSSYHWLSIYCVEQRPPVKDILSCHPEAKVLRKFLQLRECPDIHVISS